MFAAKGIVTLVSRLVGPGFNTLSMLQVVLPHSFVLSAIDMLVDSRTVCLIVRPETIVNITIYMSKGTLAMSSVLAPFTVVFGSIRPNLCTSAITETALPLSGIDRSSLESIGRPVYSGLIGIVKTLCNCLTRFLLGEVLAAAELLGLQHGD